MKAIGTRSVTLVALVAGVVVLQWRLGLVRADYWAQLDPWVTFLAAAFAMLCGTMIFGFWRLGERSEYYFRFGERLPWSAEIPLFGSRDHSVIVGHAAQPDVVDFPPIVQRVGYVVVVFGLGLVAIDNRGVALLRDAPARFSAASDVCAEPAPPEVVKTQTQGCQLVTRAFQLGYAKSLGSCAPKEPEKAHVPVCRKRQADEPFLHYEWRVFEARLGGATGGRGPGALAKLGDQLDHLGALLYATIDSVAMRPRSSHHLFTNLPDPRPSLRERIDATVSRRCGARLVQAPHILPLDDSPVGRSLLLEHVVDHLVFNPLYKPVVAQCGELIIHWNAPADTCARLVEHPHEVLAEQDALAAIAEVLAWRRRKAELAHLHMRELGDPPAADRIASVQCLMFGETDEAVVDHAIDLDGDTLHVRAVHATPLAADPTSQIRLYKRLAELLAEGFSYGHLTSTESVGAKSPAGAAFDDSHFMLAKLDLLRDADLFLGNDWLAQRPDLLAVYPYHLHLKNFVEIFRKQYKLHRGRL